jgi:NADH-ubiquinone oxidoreductase chain 5
VHYNQIEAEFLQQFFKLLPLCVVTISTLSAYFFYAYYLDILFWFTSTPYGKLIYNFFNRKWFFDKIYNESLAQHFLVLGYNSTYKTVDRGVIELFGPKGFVYIIQNITSTLSQLQTGYLYHYSFLMLTGLCFLMLTVYNSFFVLDLRVIFIYVIFALTN